jgi:molybdopterin-guanine dinucleotide biosynthesis protein A
MLAVSGVVLAGGQSKRMGANKAFLDVGGRPIIERVLEQVSLVAKEVILVANAPNEYAHLDCPVVPDVFSGKGALGGVYSGLKAARNPQVLVVGCDMPFLSAALLRYMILLAPGYDIVVPRTEKGIEPLHALYAKTCLPIMERMLQHNNLKIVAFFSQFRVRYVEQSEVEVLDPRHLSFFNVNTPDDLEWARRMATEVDMSRRRKGRNKGLKKG